MTDETPTPPEGTDDLFAVVPTAKWALETERRLLAVEERTPAEDPDDELLHERLDRHRAEIETLKTAFNDLVRWVVHQQGSAPDELQPAPVTTTTDQESYL